jgi:DNA-binding transcriptional MerR regulator
MENRPVALTGGASNVRASFSPHRPRTEGTVTKQPIDTPEPDTLSIADLAERAGTTRRTIRYYVAEGLLPSPGGRGQRRVYTDEHLIRLQAILRLKEAFLPLSEIRRRLEGMSIARLQEIVSPSHDAAERDRLAHIAFLLSDPSVSRQELAGFLTGGPAPEEQSGPSVWPRQLAADRTARPDPPVAAKAPEIGASGDDVWHRVALAPGVELHYQLSGDRRRDEAIAHLIRAAASMLAHVPPHQR